MGFNLTGNEIKNTYQRLVTISGSVLANGTGSDISNLTVTSSYALTASVALNVPVTASYALSASQATTASHAIDAEQVYTTQTNANQDHFIAFVATTNAYEGLETDNQLVYNPNSNLLTVTASRANNATSASFATTASFALNVTPQNTSSFVITASTSNATTTFTKGDGSTFSTTVNNVQNASTASSVGTLSSLNVNGAAVISGSLNISSSITANNVVTNQTDTYTSTPKVHEIVSLTAAEYGALGTKQANTLYNITDDSGSGLITNALTTASIATNIITFTKSDGRTFNLAVTSSGIQSSGSFMITGSVLNDTLSFLKGDGSAFSLVVNNVTSSISSSVATSASFATTASFALNAGGASVNTGSLLTTASAAGNIITFTKGDASTFNVTVATGSNAFPYTGSAQITGSLGVTGSIVLSDPSQTFLRGNNDFNIGNATATQAIRIVGSETLFANSTNRFDSSNFEVNSANIKLGDSLSDNLIISASTVVTGSLKTSGSNRTLGKLSVTQSVDDDQNGVLNIYSTRIGQDVLRMFEYGSQAYIRAPRVNGYLVLEAGGGANDSVFIYGTVDVRPGAMRINRPLTISGSTNLTGSFDTTGSVTFSSGYITLTQVSQSLNYVDDTAAAAGGVPLGGLYRNGNAIMIRLT